MFVGIIIGKPGSGNRSFYVQRTWTPLASWPGPAQAQAQDTGVTPFRTCGVLGPSRGRGGGHQRGTSSKASSSKGDITDSGGLGERNAAYDTLNNAVYRYAYNLANE